MNTETNYAMLDMMLRPAFCTADGVIRKCNAPALSFGLEEGTAVAPLLLTGQEELEALQDGCLYLQLALSSGVQGASVTRMENLLVFILDQADSELQALSLAARELRSPVNSLLAISGSLLPAALPDTDPKVTDLLARISRELYRLHRILGNMTDGVQASTLSRQEVRNMAQIFDDIFRKASAYLSLSGISLSYQGLPQDVFGLIDMDQMERAVLNILSNAGKFLSPEGKIHAALTRRGNTLRLSIQDDGPGIPEEVFGSLFQRYLRQPDIEDPRHGLGLGMVMIRAAAASHGGTVLVDRQDGRTRVTMTMKIRRGDTAKVQSPRQDLSGGRDQALIELSQLLPVSVYEKEL